MSRVNAGVPHDKSSGPIREHQYMAQSGKAPQGAPGVPTRVPSWGKSTTGRARVPGMTKG